MSYTSSVSIALLVGSLAACATVAKAPPPPSAEVDKGDVVLPYPVPGPTEQQAAAPGAKTSSCSSEQFAACTSGKDCERRQGILVRPHRCYDHAAEACAALSCAHGCNIYYNTPKDVICAPNASSSSHMTRCAGYANWACPETMRCDMGNDIVLDGMGVCVPAEAPAPTAPR